MPSGERQTHLLLCLCCAVGGLHSAGGAGTSAGALIESSPVSVTEIETDSVLVPVNMNVSGNWNETGTVSVIESVSVNGTSTHDVPAQQLRWWLWVLLQTPSLMCGRLSAIVDIFLPPAHASLSVSSAFSINAPAMA